MRKNISFSIDVEGGDGGGLVEIGLLAEKIRTVINCGVEEVLSHYDPDCRPLITVHNILLSYGKE